MPTRPAPVLPSAVLAGPPRPVGLTLSWQKVVNAAFAVAVATQCIAFVEPSPYDVLIIGAFAVWFLGGFTVHWLVVPLAAILFVYDIGGFLALLPYLNEPDPTTFMVLSVYLTLTAVLFAVFFAENTLSRTEACLQGYAVGCVVAGLFAIVGYFNIGGLGDRLTLYGRASSTFKDPNVLGSYLVLGAAYYMQGLMLGRVRRVLPTLAGLGVILSGIFLSFSRGSWGVLVGSLTIMVALTLLTQGAPRIRRRVMIILVAAVALAAVALVILLSLSSVQDMLGQRLALVQDYDGGETGRFGNQMRAIPMLLDRITGFGPVRFRLFFPEDSHSSYIGAFSSYGWLGGGAFLLLVGLTIAIGFRQVLAPSPFQRVAQVIWPCLFALFVQAFQIDIDHWRHIHLMLGAVWGIEAARLKWRDRQRATPGRTATIQHGPETAPLFLT